MRPRALGLLGLIALLPAAAWANAGAAARFETEVLAQGLFVTYGLAFVYGLGAVLNGCVYPLIPITLSVIGARGAQSRRRALASSATYVLGMAVMYTFLGVLAASLGQILGFTFQNPWLMGFVVAVFFGMALSLFGVWELHLPTGWTRKLVTGRGHYPSVFFMGLVAGIVAAPCTAPFLFNLLAYVGKTGDVSLGASTLFVFSLGLGLPFLVLGAFSGALARLPKSGSWLLVVKYVFGAVMLGFGVYYMRYVVGPELAPVVSGALLVVLGAIAAVEITPRAFTDRLLRAGGVAAMAFGLVYFASGLGDVARTLHGGPEPAPVARGSIQWLASEEEALARARAEGKPMLVDFWATWCKSCTEIDREVLRHPAVVSEATRFVSVKVDSTKLNDTTQALHRKYGISGLPAVVLLDAEGAPRLTITEKLPPDEFVSRMREVRCGEPRDC